MSHNSSNATRLEHTYMYRSGNVIERLFWIEPSSKLGRGITQVNVSLVEEIHHLFHASLHIP